MDLAKDDSHQITEAIQWSSDPPGGSLSVVETWWQIVFHSGNHFHCGKSLFTVCLYTVFTGVYDFVDDFDVYGFVDDFDVDGFFDDFDADGFP